MFAVTVRRNGMSLRATQKALATFASATLIAALAACPALAQTTYGPGPGGALVDKPTGQSFGLFTSEIVISGTGLTIDQINSVTLTNLTHTWVGDLVIQLSKDDTGEFITLASPPDFRDANLNGTYTFVVNPLAPTFDEASEFLGDSDTLAGGTYAISDYGGGEDNGPRNSFDNFAGVALDGTWSLAIADFGGGDTGTLGSWSFNATPAAAAAVPEPGTVALMGVGLLAGAGAMTRRRKRTTNTLVA